MFKRTAYISLVLVLLLSCKMNYSFSGINISKDVQTFEVPYVSNNAPIVVPGINEDFRNQLIEKITRLTNLSEVRKNGDLVYEMEISEYGTQPIAASANQTASMSRLTIGIKVSYTNNKNEDDDFSRTFSHYYDYSANQNLTDIQDAAHKEIFDRIIQDIFNETLAKW